MFFDFLRTKEIKSQIDATNHLLENLKNSNKKLEDIVTTLYINTSEDKELAQDKIEEIKLTSEMYKFYDYLITPDIMEKEIEKIDKNEYISESSKIDPNDYDWKNYLKKTSVFDIDIEEEPNLIKKNVNNSKLFSDLIKSKKESNLVVMLTNHGMGRVLDYNEIASINSIYNKYICKSSKEQRMRFFESYINSISYDQY